MVAQKKASETQAEDSATGGLFSKASTEQEPAKFDISANDPPDFGTGSRTEGLTEAGVERSEEDAPKGESRSQPQTSPDQSVAAEKEEEILNFGTTTPRSDADVGGQRWANVEDMVRKISAHCEARREWQNHLVEVIVDAVAAVLENLAELERQQVQMRIAMDCNSSTLSSVIGYLTPAVESMRAIESNAASPETSKEVMKKLQTSKQQ